LGNVEQANIAALADRRELLLDELSLKEETDLPQPQNLALKQRARFCRRGKSLDLRANRVELSAYVTSLLRQ
jgi:hypothetical protein